ncbi:FAD-dependent oxidoreductase [Rhodobacterales bacterium HKCCE3408]|nr:FAD-dependent oxidoreductase [Rhodobacterales bacterium HKCCE3408]
MTISADLPAAGFPKRDYFGTFLQHPPSLPKWVWWFARVAAFGYAVALIALLVIWPELGLTLFWGVTIPALPMMLVVAPGLWRQVCPMAFLNYLPRRFGFSRLLTLPDRWREASFGIAVLAFVVAISTRVPLLNQSGTALAVTLIAVLGAAFAGGVVFKGRSGWCGTFCPLGPIQRTYGQAPLVVVPNGMCESCVGCQKNCYDFSPRTAVFSDVLSENPRHAAQRRLFRGLLPGLILGYFLQGPNPDYGISTYLLVLYGACCLSVGLYWILDSFLPIEPYRLSLAFGAIALASFYWFAGPILVETLDGLLGITPSPDMVSSAHAVCVVAAALLLVSGIASHSKYLERSAARVPAVRPAPRRNDEAAVTDRATGTRFEVVKGKSLLDAVEAAGLKISSGCRSGMCGADAVAICDGMENLDPPGPDELATLRRMGLEGKARLACMCRVKGPVVIDRDPTSSAASVAAAPAIDHARAIGLNRVVIVGNGIAGTTAAQAIRRMSPSVAIDMVTNETTHFYNRMAIGRLLHSASGQDGMQMVSDSWFDENRVEVRRNTVATEIDRTGRHLLLATGERLGYDRLVLATGARPAVPDDLFLTHRNAFVMRSSDDAHAIRAFVQTHGARRAAVLGGGVLGVEAAEALNKLGLQVALIQRSDRLMNAQLDAETAACLAAYLDRSGIRVATGSTVSGYDSDGDLIHAARLAHGPTVRADIYLACLGNQSNDYLARQAGLDCRRGIVVDDLMRTSDPHILAIGDVAEPRSGITGLWPIGAAQADTAVSTIFGNPAPYRPPRTVLNLKSDGIDVRAFGDLTPKTGDEIFVAPRSDPARWRILRREGKIVGAAFAGPPGSGQAFIAAVTCGDVPDGAIAGAKRQNRNRAA